MNAPPWLPNLLAAVMMLLAAYSLWRLAMARLWGRTTDYEADALHALIGIATAGLLVKWMDGVPRAAWTAVFVLAAAWFAARTALLLRADAATAGDSGYSGGGNIAAATPRAGTAALRARLRRSGAGRPAVHAAASLIMVYMFLAGVAPSTIQGSTAGEYTMAGMPDMIKDATVSYPTVGLLLTVAMAGYAVIVLDRMAPLRSAAAPRAASPAGTAAALEADGAGSLDHVGSHGAGAGARTSPLLPLVLAPRSVDFCRVALCITMAYAILAKLV